VYPQAARTSGIEGTVVIEALMDAKGHILDARVLSGPTELRAAALRSVLDDHFASDGSASRKVQLSVVFSLQKFAVPDRVAVVRDGRASGSDSGDAAPLIVSVDCMMLPDDLCRDARQRLAAQTGSPLTAEKRMELQKELADLDDHLFLNPRKTAQGVVLAVWLHYETGFDATAGVMGGVMGGLAAAAPPPPPPPAAPPPPPDGTATTPQRIRVGGVVQAANLIHRTNPVYPPQAKQARIQGVVRFAAIIAKDGTVQDLKVISGHPLLVPAALDAVKQWQYKPTLLKGEPVEVATQIDVNFTLSQ